MRTPITITPALTAVDLDGYRLVFSERTNEQPTCEV